ncbi:MAG: hypothetical protein H6618_04725 [Deltaproteobacteria bacterium]|nr:hypothetical protein [Deltaproteobacteria bacterium]
MRILCAIFFVIFSSSLAMGGLSSEGFSNAYQRDEIIEGIPIGSPVVDVIQPDSKTPYAKTFHATSEGNKKNVQPQTQHLKKKSDYADYADYAFIAVATFGFIAYQYYVNKQKQKQKQKQMTKTLDDKISTAHHDLFVIPDNYADGITRKRYYPEPVHYHPEPVHYHPEPVHYHPEPVHYHPEPVHYHPEPVHYR